ncbi:TetR/AcrR family transcriptional regulator [Pseudonocardia acaciae]|uniref:TetR/AcrR family transcriptional regulator n=1 Tax=Pseudonocardia acaciae TaxID=551276 RepID=UPI00048B05FC|nr:TetR/AcrR family transcriptional regulator [Pseudonocardia acaciae]
MTTGRRRLSPEQRREQLLRIGARLFAERPYEQVWIEEVAERAEVSRGLLYHYFPTKRDFFAAVIKDASSRLPQLAEIDPTLPVTERLATGLDLFLRYVEANEHSYRAVHRGAVGADPDIRAVVRENNAELERRILADLGADPDARDAEIYRVAVRGWLAFVIATCLDWLDRRTITRDQLRDLCARTLLGALGLGQGEPPGSGPW